MAIRYTKNDPLSTWVARPTSRVPASSTKLLHLNQLGAQCSRSCRAKAACLLTGSAWAGVLSSGGPPAFGLFPCRQPPQDEMRQRSMMYLLQPPWRREDSPVNAPVVTGFTRSRWRPATRRLSAASKIGGPVLPAHRRDAPRNRCSRERVDPCCSPRGGSFW